MKWNWRKDLRSSVVILSAVAGSLLIIKVLIIKRIFEQDVNVTSLIFPLTMLIFFEVVDKSIKSKNKDYAGVWVHPLLWSIAIVLVTAVSLIPYLK